MLAKGRVRSIPRVGLTPAEIEALGLEAGGPVASDSEHVQLFQVRMVPKLAPP